MPWYCSALLFLLACTTAVLLMCAIAPDGQ